MGIEKIPIKKIRDFVYEIPKEGEMLVSGRVYANDHIVDELKKDIEAGKQWNALSQIRNVAMLPGIQKASLAMPDVHPGYGFPIGGVGAFDIENGIITVAGVGFDINCLTGDSRILTDFGYYKKIKDFETDFIEVENAHADYTLKSMKYIQSLVSFDINQKCFSSKHALYIMKRKHSEPILKIKTKLGYTINVTADHPILTKMGMVRSGDLGKGQEIAIHPFEGCEYQETIKDRVLVREDTFTEQEKDELKKRNLLPLNLKNPKLPILIRLFGYLFGARRVYISSQNGYLNICGPKDDLKEIQSDFTRLGFSGMIYTGTTEHDVTINNYCKVKSKVESPTKNHELRVSSKLLVKLFFKLGFPSGEKTITPYTIPKWIMESPLWVKRLFLSGFFGAELSSPIAHTNTGLTCPTISIDKNKKVVNSGREIVIQLMSLLEEFRVGCHRLLQRKDHHDKHGPVDRLKLKISSNEDNLLRLWSRIGFSYNKKKNLLSQIAILYIKEKKLLTKRRREAALKIKDLKRKGLTLKEIQKLLGSSIINRRFIRRHYHRNAEQKTALSFPPFSEFVKTKIREIKEFGCLFDKVEVILKEGYDGFVYDFNIPKTHSFIANNIIVSNCGVRTLRTPLMREDVIKIQQQLTDALYNTVPAGLGSKGEIKMDPDMLDEVAVKGAKYVINLGYGLKQDLEYTEEHGCVAGANPDNVSNIAKQRQLKQVGTLGSGNHYLEVQYVEEVYDEDAAKAYNLKKDQVVISIHCGSRAYGHQIGTDYLKELDAASKKYKIPIRERELVCAPFNSPEGKKYFSAVNCGINMAFSNRQAITHLVRQATCPVLGLKDSDIEVLYDIGHNTAKLEKHDVNGNVMQLCVMRKGATRAFGPGREEIPEKYMKIGQPVLIGGTMGTYSYILHGTAQGMNETFGSACHGAGRVMSRHQALRQFRGSDVVRDMAKQGIIVKGHSLKGVAEEAPGVYKDVNEVVDIMHESGIAKRVVRLRPLIVVMG
ncbi:hypothetical protein DRJ17_02695 [Candidatus Woesearchaeota archaeon]|nr:MAG: hypothetical protein DRJ17_02695 [Candidatus Woesearchaeota archaeon]